MPPATPTTTRGRPVSSGMAAARYGLGLDRFRGEQALVDLTQRDGQRLLVHVCLDQRADVLEQSLTELGVVGVDLTRALGGVDHQAVLGASAVEQLVDRRVGD